MEGFEEETYSTVFASLRHPIRRKILRTLSEGPQSFSDLQRTIGIESSHLTYHLEGLTSLLAKTENGEYILSSLGRIAVSTMKQVEEPPSTSLTTQFLPRFWKRERTRILALGIISIILAVGLVGVFAYHVSAINDKDSAISLLNSQVAILQNQISSANSTIAFLTSQTVELETQLASNNSMIAALQNQILSANLTIASLNFQAAELENQLVLDNSTFAVNNSTILTLQNRITAMQNQANSLQNQVNELLNKYSVHVIVSASPAGGSPPTAGAPVYFSVEPVAIYPLVNLNTSINGLEVSSSPFALDQNFTVEIHLRNATLANVPTGVAGVYVDFDFANILNYCKPIGFTTMLGQPGGVLNGDLIFALNGFYDINANPVDNASYDQATQYAVVAATTNSSLGWNNDDGLVAQITFQVTRQPSQALGQSAFNSKLPLNYVDMVDNRPRNPAEIPYTIIQGSLQIDASSP